VRTLAIVAFLANAAVAAAQGTKAPATKTAAPVQTKTAAPAQTKTVAPAQTKTVAPAQTKAPAVGGRTKNSAAQGATAQPQRRPALTIAPEAAPPKMPVIMREVFEYEAAGRRDPFVSLLSSAELRPTVADLRLVIVLYDESGRRPVAVMRDLTTNTQYRVTTGMTLGRMRVTAIKRRAVIFTIEEFGLNRQDSLVLGDTSKVRAR
jgi:hypothetical protein